MAILLIIIMQQEEERGMRTAQLEGRRPDQYVPLATGLANVHPTDLGLTHTFDNSSHARSNDSLLSSPSINSTWGSNR